jgi:hypothetical protein
VKAIQLPFARGQETTMKATQIPVAMQAMQIQFTRETGSTMKTMQIPFAREKEAL